MKFRSERSNRENGPTFSDFPLFPGFFRGIKRQNFLHLLPNRNFRKILTKWEALVALTSSLEFLVCVEKLLHKQSRYKLREEVSRIGAEPCSLPCYAVTLGPCLLYIRPLAMRTPLVRPKL